jgi:murein DD-endopeptidase MepM/ murein hydrolase activator NlpD
MARKFYTCIIVPDASQQLHKLRIPVKALYVLAAIGTLSFFAAVGLGFNYIGMATRAANLQTLEEENAKLKIDTQQLRLSTTKLNRKVIALETEAQNIAQALNDDPVLKKVFKTGPVGGSTADISTSELEGSLHENVELIRQRMTQVELNLSLQSKRTRNIRSTPRIWPLQGKIGSHYGGRLDPFTGDSEVHLGIDITAPRGSQVHATADGVVMIASWQSEYGNMVVLRHPNGFTTRYAHLSKIKVKVGDIVNREDTIGFVGMTGRATAPHLHYEVRLNDRAVNPKNYLIN